MQACSVSTIQHTYQLPQELLLVEFICVLLIEPQTKTFTSQKYSQLHAVLATPNIMYSWY